MKNLENLMPICRPGKCLCASQADRLEYLTPRMNPSEYEKDAMGVLVLNP